ncbi:hypothetical protein [Tropicimonas sp. IMCC34043]|uniref:hypothetical protein n=1 Tax=Tropicimonas sp. IMCC34043 TaxID=2248760 RepID=UPI000E272B07|nr:hypothetical protein [Tropicimonas sp. IMCC34043]
MSDIAIEKAVKVRAELSERIATAKRQITEWQSAVDRADSFIRQWEEYSGRPAPGGHASSAAIEDDAVVTPPQKPRNPRKEVVAEAAREILREHGEPMNRDELIEALPSKGITIHGKNPPVVLQTMLWRMQDRIVHLKGRGYWPRDEVDHASPDEVDHFESVGDEASDDGSEVK